MEVCDLIAIRAECIIILKGHGDYMDADHCGID